jgi:hypothetical protein
MTDVTAKKPNIVGLLHCTILENDLGYILRRQ